MVSKSATGSWRLSLFAVGVILIAGALVYRVFQLAVINHEMYTKKAQTQQAIAASAVAQRGSIYLSDFLTGEKRLSVSNRAIKYAYATGKMGDRYLEIAQKLAPILGKAPEAFAVELASQKDKSHYVIAEDLTKEQLEAIKGLGLEGVGLGLKTDRFYSQQAMAAHVLGFLGYDGYARAGQYGVEAYYNDFLSKGDVVLTIDKNIQEMVEAKLEGVMEKWQADAGSVIVQDPKTGAILAMAASPSFDPNHYSDFALTTYVNPNVQDLYEPGSTFKPITIAAALDKNVINPETTYTDTGFIQEAGYTLKNYDEKAHGVVSMREVLQKSLNTGVIFAQKLLGDDPFLNYVVDFGFGKKTGIDASGEISGNISNLYTGRKVNFYTASFGQGIAVTPLQLINAYSAIANGGKLMRPYIVKQLVQADGTIEETKSQIIGNPISDKTSKKITSMLVDVVEKGFDKARIPGYEIAGKTGTAQIPDEKGGYLGQDQFIHNFVGFAPANDPQFVVLVKIHRPKGIRFAADSLSPVFADITRFMLRYLQIPPSKAIN